MDGVRRWCEERFGPGTLSHEDNGTYRYERGSWAPKILRKLLALVLWKSYR